MNRSMKPANAIVCPACGTKNRPKWEFCVSCGESLKGVVAEVEAAPAAAAAVVEDTSGGAALSWVTTIAGIGLLVAAFRWVRGRQSEARAPDPSMFTVPAADKTPPPRPSEPRGSTEDAAVQTQLSKAEALLASGDAAGALPLLAEAVGMLPENPKAHYLYASALWHTGSREDALAQYQQAIDLDSGNRLYRAELAKGLP